MKMSLVRFGVAVATLVCLTSGEAYDHAECFSTDRGKEYVGTIAKTIEGFDCQPWEKDGQFPHSFTNYHHGAFPEGSRVEASNYCRNPDNEPNGPWCYTTNSEVRWQTCKVPRCYGRVNEVTPKVVGTGGSVKVTIKGKGFSENQFNFGSDSHMGNKVWFVNQFTQYECEVFKDGTNEEMIQCYTSIGMPVDTYHVKVSVNGVVTPDEGLCNGYPDSWWCTLYTNIWYHPTITSVAPAAGPPDTIITIYGRFYTDRYGSNIKEATNGKSEGILRVYVQGKPCELKDGDDFYGIGLWSSGSNDGYIKCKVASLPVPSNVLVSVIIDPPYGKTIADDTAQFITASGKVAMFQSYAEIESVSPTEGSTTGGQLLTITGTGFDDTTSPNVMVGDKECVVESVSDTQILCRTPEEHSAVDDSHIGNRGVKNLLFNSSVAAYATLDSLTTRSDESSIFWSDGAYWCEGDTSSEHNFCQKSYSDNFNIRSIGYFMPKLTGEYRFHMKCDDTAKLYLSTSEAKADKAVVAECSQVSRSYVDGATTVSLEAGKAYYMEYLAHEIGSAAFVYVGATYYGLAGLKAEVEGKVVPEMHKVEISSTVQNEVYDISFTDMKAQTAVEEVQVVEMSYTGDGNGDWKLGMYGVYTDPLNVDADDQKVAKAIENLAPFYPNRLKEVKDITDGGSPATTKKFQITFRTGGNWPELSSKATGDFSVSVTTSTEGVDPLTSWRFQFEHEGSTFYSDAISTFEPEVEDMEKDVLNMFQARCPPSIGPRAPGKVYYEGYEDDKNDAEVEPFCGRYAAKNPSKIFDDKYNLPINLALAKYICFAHRGKFEDYVRVQYRIASGKRYSYYPKNNFDQSSYIEWFYTCIDVLEMVETAKPGEGPYTLLEFEVYRPSHVDVWIDEVVIAGSKTTENNDLLVDEQRVKSTVQVSSVSVEKNEVTKVYSVTIKPEHCANNFKMLQIYQAPKLSGSIGKSASSVTFGDSAGTVWPSGSSIKIDRTSKASPPVTGSWNLTYDSKTEEFDAAISAKNLQDSLRIELGLEGVRVSRGGTCYGYDYEMEFTNLDDAPSTIDAADVSLAGDTPVLEKEHIKAHLFYDPIPGDMVATSESSAQVRVAVNSIASRCKEGASCGYGWSADLTPSISSITPTNGGEGVKLTIDGTKFSTTAADNMVMIGKSACTASASTATQITCTLGKGDVGTHEVKVTVAEKGLASGAVSFEVDSGAVDSVDPATGSSEGGTSVTISGNGFADGSTVTIDGKTCEVTGSITPTQIVCITPDNTKTTAVTISVSSGGQTLEKTSAYTYNDAQTPKITSFTPSSPSASGGEKLEIVGEGLQGLEYLTVELEDSSSKRTELDLIETKTTDTAIASVLPALAPDTYTIIVKSAGKGLAKFTGSATLTVTLRVDAISAQKGSFEGGTRLIIKGAGFGNDSEQVVVKTGTAECDIETIVDDAITCLTGRGGQTVVVGNSGTDTIYGLGYAWDKPVVEIKAGDIVRFQWASPLFVEGVKFKVMQAPNAHDPNDGTGFDSGNGTYNGHYEYQFNDVGTFYYTTGVMGPKEDIEMRGKVIVSERQAFAAAVTVERGGQAAEMNSGSGVTITLVTNCGEKGTTDAIGSCTESNPVSPAEFEFAYLDCYTPELTAQDVSQGYIDTAITLTGTGFSATPCDNEVAIGEYGCTVTSASATEIVCNMEASEEPDVGVSFDLNVRVNNRGYPQVKAENRKFALLPSMKTISPAKGSVNGGTKVTIDGAGFVGVTSVFVGPYECSIDSQTYTKIVCTTSAAGSASTQTIEVSVTNSLGVLQPVKCDAVSCDFEYDVASTPTLTSVTSPSGNLNTASTTVEMAGTGLGTETGDVTIWVGDVEGTVSAVADTSVTFSITGLAAGTHATKVLIAGLGLATGPSITVDLVCTDISPSAGSIWGGQAVTVTGSGFSSETAVSINNIACEVKDPMSATQVICVTGASAAADQSVVKVDINVSGVGNCKDLKFDYDSTKTPTITSIDPTSGAAGDTITITGTEFSASSSTVHIGGVECTGATGTTTSLECTAGSSVPGTVNVIVTVDQIGVSNNDITFDYELSSGSIDEVQGSFGGGQVVTLTGNGFTDATTITLCGVSCAVNPSAVTTTTVEFTTPSMEQDYGSASKSCDLVVTVGDRSSTLASAYTYTQGNTAVISSVSPARGGTKGGTKVTITGERFSVSGNDVTIDGTTCTVDSESETEIICETGEPSSTVKSHVVVKVANKGVSLKANAQYWYVDVWSSKFTWGGLDPPTAGEFVVVKEGQTLLLDVDTEVMKMILIQGGELLFDDKDLTLRSENILIVGGGGLTVGTEEKPFEHEATIEMHGQLRAPELPIYGAKCLAVREGELSLHGKFKRMTWTRLGQTAAAGATEIVLEYGQADWPIGGLIAIATTGDRHSQKETETRRITAISGDGKTLTLDEALTYEHLGVTEELAPGYNLEMRAEVALLTRNVRVIGSRDIQWSDEIEACPDGFDTGEFATQTCFQGRFGDEIGSDQFGAQIMIHAPVKDEKIARAKLSYIEVNYAGQAFRLGRYPIHFHLNGDMNGSYVRGLAIHETFNRAVNIHGSHNLLVEHTVIYNVMGGAFFLEDGIETGNRYLYNLALFVKASTSLLNDDITPAAFWATNPDNHYLHNAAAGGTHFGWWYRLLEHPEGPSATDTVCPRNVPLGTAYNNTVHSNGWFGLWTFQDYHPMVGGGCGSTEPEPAVFEKFIVWNCEKGLEFVNGGSLQFKDCLLANNKLTGLEGKLTMKLGSEAPYTDRGPLIRDSVIAAYAPNHKHASGGKRIGVILPWSEGFSVLDSTFINFDSEEEIVFGMTSIDGTCGHLCGAYNYHMSGLKFVNGDQHLGIFRWQHDGIFVDKDGSLGGLPGGNILPWMETLDPAKCMKDSRFSVGNAEGAVCDATTGFARLSFNKPNLDSMMFKDVHFTNDFGTHVAKFTDKRLTHADGWTTIVQLGETYKMVWENIEHITNISYSASFYDMAKGSVIITHNMSSMPDRVVVDGVTKELTEAAPAMLSADSNVNGDFYFDENKKEFSYMVSGKNQRAKRAATTEYIVFSSVPSAYVCYWPDCEPPPDPNSIPPADSRPDHAVFWSTYTWPSGKPADTAEGVDVKIEEGVWMVADEQFPKMKTLLLHGTLELDDTKSVDFKMEVEFIIIMGGRLIAGWPDERFKGNLEIILNGDIYSEQYPQTSGATIGVKAVAVYGGLDLHGKSITPTIVHLAATADAGATTITVDSDVTYWKVTDKVMITATTYDALEAEIHEITAIDGRVITLDKPLQFKHLGESLTDENGNTYSLAAEVSVLTRNIKVRGGNHADMVRLGLGGRVLVSSTAAFEDGEIKSYVGWARVGDVQFINMGQYGYTNSFDPRYAIAYVGTGESTNIKPSYLDGNTFEGGFSPAIGLFGADGLNVIDNVMHQVVGGGLVVHGKNHLIKHNMVALNLWPGSYNGRQELKNVAYEAAFELTQARETKVFDNIAAGSERAGFSLAGELCEDVSAEDLRWKGNRAHSCMFGVMMWEGDEINTECFRVSGFTAWKNYDYGIFIQTPSINIELEDNVMIENGLGLWTHTFGHNSLSHIRKEKVVTVRRGYVSGPTEHFDCSLDKKPATESYARSSMARSWRIKEGTTGLSINNADGSPNGLPTHPFAGRMSYPTIDARMDIEGVTFANFGERQCNGKTLNDFALSTNPSSDDITHPVNMKENTVESSAAHENLVYFHAPRVSKVNPSDCVDMECDGHKKALVHDLDGTFIGQGTPSTVIDNAAVNWDGDKRYGIGDYRIPKAMLTAPDNTRIDPPTKHGLFQDSTCAFVDKWRAFRCQGPKYRMLVLESMDADTEVRRLSPIGFKARSSNGDVMDLLNGPQDHGWCAGYTCQKRVSIFWAIVADGETFDVYLTGTNPQKTRFYMLQAEESESVRIAVYYFSPQRLDVFSNQIYVYPTNAEITGDGKYNIKPSEQTPSEHIPALDAVSGANYFDREWQLQYLIIKGTNVVDVVIKQVVIVSLTLPPMTIDDFFGEQIIGNLAAFLGVPENKIRIVNVISESSLRRRRATSGTVVEFEIGDEPSAGTNVTQVNDGELDRSTLLNLTRKVVDSVQLGTLGDSLNLTILGIDVQEPLPEPENSTSSSWAILSSKNTSEVLATIQIPNEMQYTTELVAERAQQPFPTQPEFSMYDASMELVEILGSREDPWKIRATLNVNSASNPSASLIGEITCGFKDGVCAFENLGISHEGTGYVIEFEIFDPKEASSYSAVSSSISVAAAELSAGFTEVPDKDSPVMVGEEFTAVVDIRDLTSEMRVEDIGSTGEVWTASISIYQPEMSPDTNLTGTLERSFNTTSGLATFDDLAFSTRGRYSLKATVKSASSTLATARSTVIEVKRNQTMQTEELGYKISLRIQEDYETYAKGNEDLVEAAVYNMLQEIDDTIRYHDFVISEGSILIDLESSGEATHLATFITTIASSLSNGTSLALPGGIVQLDSYLMLDGAVHGGLSGATTTVPTTTVEEDVEPITMDNPKSHVTTVTPIVVGCVLALGFLTFAIVMCVLKIQQKKRNQKIGDSVIYPSRLDEESTVASRAASRNESPMGYEQYRSKVDTTVEKEPETTTLKEFRSNKSAITIAIVISVVLVLIAVIVLIVVIVKKKSVKTAPHGDAEYASDIMAPAPQPALSTPN